MKGHIAEAKVLVVAPPERVWNALTDPEQVRHYMMGTNLETDWQPGSQITWSGEYAGKAYVDRGEVLEADEGKRLAYTHYSPLSGAADSPENYHTLVWTLNEIADGTELSVSQDNNATVEEADSNRVNWLSMLASLKAVVEG